MTVPSVAVAATLGPEFPSLLGGQAGLVIVMTASRRGFLMPDRVWDFPPRERWSERGMGDIESRTDAVVGKRMSPVVAWSPYVIVAGLLVLTRTVAPETERLTSISIGASDIFGTGISGAAVALALVRVFINPHSPRSTAPGFGACR